MKVYLVGAGPGDPGLITVKGREVLSSADVVVYDALINESLLSLLQPAAEKIYVGKRQGWHALSQGEISALLVERSKQGKVVVRLKGGDPFLFGRGGEEANALANAGIAFEVVPGVSSALAVPAYAGIPVTHRELCRVLTICTGHSAVHGAAPLDFSVLAKTQGTLVFLMSVKFLRHNVTQLLAHGMSPETKAAIIEWGTTPSQRVITSTLGGISEEAEQQKIGAPSILVLGEVVGLRERLSWFVPPPLSGKRVLVTRAKEQAEELCQRLLQAGATPVLLPTIELRALPMTKEALTRVSGASWVVFTSASAVRFYGEALFDAGLDVRIFASAKIAAVGEKTCEALRSLGLRADFIPPEARSESLAQTLPLSSQEKILFYRPREVAFDLKGALSQRGAIVDEVVLYENIPASAAAIPPESLEALTFASPSAAESLLLMYPDEERRALLQKKAVAIGPTTAEALRRLGFTSVVVAQKPSAESMVEALSMSFNDAEPYAPKDR